MQDRNPGVIVVQQRKYNVIADPNAICTVTNSIVIFVFIVIHCLAFARLDTPLHLLPQASTRPRVDQDCHFLGAQP
jgi:hypothetical protein